VAVIRIPEKVLEDIRWNAQHGKCSQCIRIYALVEGGEIDTSKLSQEDLNHLKYVIETYEGRKAAPIM